MQNTPPVLPPCRLVILWKRNGIIPGKVTRWHCRIGVPRTGIHPTVKGRPDHFFFSNCFFTYIFLYYTNRPSWVHSGSTARYAIYDSRAVFSLNWLIFRYCEKKRLFPQPIGRSTAISDYDTQTLFRLSRTDHQYRSHKTAYHDYCSLLQDLSEEIYDNRRPYFVEMLLFLAAPRNIIDDIKSSVTVTIGGKENNMINH